MGPKGFKVRDLIYFRIVCSSKRRPSMANFLGVDQTAQAIIGEAKLQVILGWHEVSNREEDINQTHFIMDCLRKP